MVLKCNVWQCCYNDNNSCRRGILCIQENGTCSWMYNKDTIRKGFMEKQKDVWEDE